MQPVPQRPAAPPRPCPRTGACCGACRAARAEAHPAPPTVRDALRVVRPRDAQPDAPST